MVCANLEVISVYARVRNKGRDDGFLVDKRISAAPDDLRTQQGQSTMPETCPLGLFGEPQEAVPYPVMSRLRTCQTCRSPRWPKKQNRPAFECSLFLGPTRFVTETTCF